MEVEWKWNGSGMEVEWKWNGNWKRKMEMETGNGKWKWKLETEMEMRQSLARGIAHAQGRYCTRHRVEMVLCMAMEEGTEGFVVITCVLL